MIFLLFAFNLLAGGDVFQRITIENGLSQNMVNDILLDHQGFLWFATKDGLNRYDGYEFAVYRNYPGQQEGLSSNHITSLWQTSDGAIWMTTYGGGVNRLNPLSGLVMPLHPNFDPATTTATDLAFATLLRGDSSQNLWILGQNNQLYHLDGQSHQLTKLQDLPSMSAVAEISLFEITPRDHIWAIHSKTIQYIVPADTILQWHVERVTADSPTSMIAINDSLLLFSTRTGLHYLHRHGNTLHRTPTRVQGQNFGFGSSFIRAPDGRIWLTTLTDTYQFNPADETLIWLFRHDTRPTTTTIDNSGILWIGTAGWGLIKYNPDRQYIRRSTEPFPPLILNEILRAMEQSGYAIPDWDSGIDYAFDISDSGDIWLATIGFGLYRYRPSEGDLRRYFSDTDFTRFNLNRGFNRIFIAPDNTIWLAVSGGLIALNPQTATHTYHPIYPDAITNQEYINKTGNPDITAIAQDASGDLWVGTPDRGLARYTPQTDQVIWYRHLPGDPASLSSNQILSILPDPRQPELYLWIGTEGGGLNRITISTGTIDTWFTSDGLPSMVIYGILSDDDQNLWLSTNNGLVRKNLNTGEIRGFTVADGLHSREFNRFEYFRYRNGNLYFGGIGGHTTIIPSLLKPNTYQPVIRLTNFLLFNRPYDQPFIRSLNAGESTVLHLRYYENMISFAFAALEFTTPDNNRYRYKMEGFDRNWINSGNIRTATYTNLSPGSYTFIVQATNSDGLWSTHELRLPIYITPPFWMTWWFRILVVLFIASILAYLVYLRIEKLRLEKVRQEEVTLKVIEKQEEERRRIAHEMHDGLGQELLVLKNMLYRWSVRPESATPAEMLTTASNHIGGVLKSVREITHNLRPPELDRIGITETIRYMLEKSTDASGIDLDADIRPINRLIPSEQEINLLRIVQELLSNTLKHSGATQVRCTVIPSETHIHLFYSDNGKGLPSDVDAATFQRGLGILSLTERVRILRGTLSTPATDGTGLAYEISIPITKK